MEKLLQLDEKYIVRPIMTAAQNSLAPGVWIIGAAQVAASYDFIPRDLRDIVTFFTGAFMVVGLSMRIGELESTINALEAGYGGESYGSDVNIVSPVSNPVPISPEYDQIDALRADQV